MQYASSLPMEDPFAQKVVNWVLSPKEDPMAEIEALLKLKLKSVGRQRSNTILRQSRGSNNDPLTYSPKRKLEKKWDKSSKETQIMHLY